jgi:hypothetical protein
MRIEIGQMSLLAFLAGGALVVDGTRRIYQEPDQQKSKAIAAIELIAAGGILSYLLLSKPTDTELSGTSTPTCPLALFSRKIDEGSEKIQNISKHFQEHYPMSCSNYIEFGDFEWKRGETYPAALAGSLQRMEGNFQEANHPYSWGLLHANTPFFLVKAMSKSNTAHAYREKSELFMISQIFKSFDLPDLYGRSMLMTGTGEAYPFDPFAYQRDEALLIGALQNQCGFNFENDKDSNLLNGFSKFRNFGIAQLFALFSGEPIKIFDSCAQETVELM